MVQIQIFFCEIFVFFFFTYFLDKMQKNYLRCFYMRFLNLKILILFLKLYVLLSFFENFLF